LTKTSGGGRGKNGISKMASPPTEERGSLVDETVSEKKTVQAPKKRSPSLRPRNDPRMEGGLTGEWNKTKSKGKNGDDRQGTSAKEEQNKKSNLPFDKKKRSGWGGKTFGRKKKNFKKIGGRGFWAARMSRYRHGQSGTPNCEESKTESKALSVEKIGSLRLTANLDW